MRSGIWVSALHLRTRELLNSGEGSTRDRRAVDILTCIGRAATWRKCVTKQSNLRKLGTLGRDVWRRKHMNKAVCEELRLDSLRAELTRTQYQVYCAQPLCGVLLQLLPRQNAQMSVCVLVGVLCLSRLEHKQCEDGTHYCGREVGIFRKSCLGGVRVRKTQEAGGLAGLWVDSWPLRVRHPQRVRVP